MKSSARITEVRRGTTIDITIVADTYADALEARDDYYSRYQHGGYGTSFREPRPARTGIGKVVITGWRGNSS